MSITSAFDLKSLRTWKARPSGTMAEVRDSALHSLANASLRWTALPIIPSRWPPIRKGYD